MRFPFCGLLILLLFSAFGADAQKANFPHFEDYPVTVTFKGRNHPVILDSNSRAFRTRLREAGRETPNFADHYVVTIWGCGTGCVMGAIVDAVTGKVQWFPGTICCWYEMGEEVEPVEFRRNSRLIILNGMINEKGDVARRYYKFEKNRLVLISTEKVLVNKEHEL
jgi:hypothetical protein